MKDQTRRRRRKYLGKKSSIRESLGLKHTSRFSLSAKVVLTESKDPRGPMARHVTAIVICQGSISERKHWPFDP